MGGNLVLSSADALTQQYASLVNSNSLINSVNGYSDLANPLSMNGSILGSSGNFNNYAYGGMSQELYTLYNTDYMKYLDKKKKVDEQQVRNDYDLQATKAIYAEGAKTKLNATKTVVDDKLNELNAIVKSNKQDYFQDAYAELTTAVASYLKKRSVIGDDFDITKSTDSEEAKLVRSTAKQLYETKFETSLENDLERNGDSEFVLGLKKGTGIGWWLGNNKNYKDNIAFLTDKKVTKAETASQAIGAILSFAGLIGAGIVLRKARTGKRLADGIGNMFHGLDNIVKESRIRKLDSTDQELKLMANDTKDEALRDSIVERGTTVNQQADVLRSQLADDKVKYRLKKLGVFT